MGFVEVARVDDIPTHRGLCVKIRGIDIGLFRVGDGVHAMENQCPHAGAPLSEGELDGFTVFCPQHGWDFDVRTGFRVEDADGFPIPCFAVRVKEGTVEVDIDQPTNSQPAKKKLLPEEE